MNIKKILRATALSLLAVAATAHGRERPTGNVQKSFGPRGQGTAEASRTVEGGNTNGTLSISGPNGKGISGETSSSRANGAGSGQMSVTTSGGRSATLQGSGSIQGNTATGEGSIQTSSGRGATGQTSVTKTDDGFDASRSVTSNSGKTVSGTVEGNKDGGTFSVTTPKGSVTHEYGPSERPRLFRR